MKKTFNFIWNSSQYLSRNMRYFYYITLLPYFQYIIIDKFELNTHTQLRANYHGVFK
jgi:hypothetical protein